MRGHRNHLAGQRIGAVEVLDRAGRTLSGHALWRCLCHACGSTLRMRGGVLVRGVASCGCLRGGSTERRPRPQPLTEEQKGSAGKLTPTQVVDIRVRWAQRTETGATATSLARAFAVSRRLIELVVSRQVWAHVGGADDRAA